MKGGKLSRKEGRLSRNEGRKCIKEKDGRKEC